MSGIVGIFNLDGAPVDGLLLEQMTDFLAFRGPDAKRVWIDGHVGFGHTLLRTTEESLHERQPCSLHGAVWITADARIDDRKNLINKLTALGCAAHLDRPDVELILHAYHVWGERCVEHLLGDFAFAIWDSRQRRLFCARDHFGIKPFYYARVGDCLVFSNTLNSVRLHPSVSPRLNDLAIADFLLFGDNQDVATTAFADVRRLPPAHTMTCSVGTARVARYWSLPLDGELRYRRAEQYVEHLDEVLSHAVSDRLRASRVALLMSGGIDSTSVAAVARSLVRDRRSPAELHAFTIVYDSLIPDKERYYAQLAADALNIPIHFLSADGYTLYEGWERPELQTPEPCNGPGALAIHDLQRRVAAYGRIALTGHGGDAAMLGSATSYVLSLLRNGSWGCLAVDLWNSLSRGYLPKIGFRTRLRRWSRRGQHRPLPVWINPDLALHLNLDARWSGLEAEQPGPHPRRPDAYRCLSMPFWSCGFEVDDPGTTRLPVEHRHPFFDLRVLAYFLAIPPVPWCDNKVILRSAMVGLLPQAVRNRLKTPLAGDPDRQLLGTERSSWIDQFEACPELEQYVVRQRIPRLSGEQDGQAIRMNLRPMSLNYWLSTRNDGLVPPRAYSENPVNRTSASQEAFV